MQHLKVKLKKQQNLHRNFSQNSKAYWKYFSRLLKEEFDSEIMNHAMAFPPLDLNKRN